MRSMLVGAAVLGLGAMLSLGIMLGGTAGAAASKCDSGITKAAGKKVACKTGVIAAAQKKGTTPDATKLGKCTSKFSAACSKAKAAGDCMVHTESCGTTETHADTCVTNVSSSPSGAFLSD